MRIHKMEVTLFKRLEITSLVVDQTTIVLMKLVASQATGIDYV